MKNSLNRRSFIKHAAVAATAVSTARFLPRVNAQASSHLDKLNCVQIGCGGRGTAHIEEVIGRKHQVPYAFVDPDERQHRLVKLWLKKNNLDPEKSQFFTDYREMFDKIGKNVDAVFITAPNHHHATATTIALQTGKNVYCEKPLCHDIADARRLRLLAKDNPKLATQMGNQGHCMEGYRRLCEYIWSGAIGQVTETHSWTDRANGGVGPRPPILPVPAGMHWDAWIGPAPYRDFHSDLHPHEWHGWYDFGNGSIGNMGCHILDGVFWALKLEHPLSIEMEEVRGGSDERYPLGSRIRWDCPARGDMAAVKVYWYEGLNQTTTAMPQGSNKAAKGSARNIPPLLAELQKQYPDEQFDTDGTLYVGEKGVIYTGPYGDRMHIVPMEKMQSAAAVAKTLPRPKDIFSDFINTCLAGRADTSAPFEYGARLTEFSLLGNLAQHAGRGRKVEWDAANMKVANIPELNAWIGRAIRQGWRV
ncbi:MAG TPA: Gfo/Idh/MocA family oxidoreductase [Verrucomicrobiae bacterium]|jgi:predicted dehydrogenase|nr:Gfo/Idh/MocA family oxidoreductase [Verrucomicrobiae bacterium]